MDDSTAELPVSPPALPADNIAGLRAAHDHLATLAADKSLTAQKQRAEAALDMGDLWQAEALANTILQRLPKDRSARLTLAASLRRQIRFAAATRLYQQLVQEDSRDSDAYLGLADTAFAANQRPQAFIWLDRTVAQGTQTVLSLTTLAHRYQDWKDYPKAEATAAKALSIAPDDTDALLQLASIQVESGKLDAGYNSLGAVFHKDSNNGLAHRLMGVVLMNTISIHYDMNRARTLLERAVELDGKDVAIYRAAAVIYRQQRLYRLAAQAYDALLHLDPTSLDGRYGLGQVYALLGKTELSRQQLALYKQLDERQRRITRLSEEMLHYPESAESHLALARFLQSSGDYARALPEFQIAAGLAPHNSLVQTELRRFYTSLGWKLPEHKIQ